MNSLCIIIPVYNAEKYICRCIESVLKQTCSDFHVIMIDDGSKDSSLEICQSFARDDSRITVLAKENGGAASARNYGLNWAYQYCKSKWIGFLDIDDFIHERYLEILLFAAKKNNSDVTMCSYIETTEDKIQLSIDKIDVQYVNTEDLWCERQINCTVPFAKLFKSELFRNVRFPEGIVTEDEYTLYKVVFKTSKIAFVDIPLYGYYQSEQSVMRGQWTPRFMAGPKGLKEQLLFFQKNNYSKAAAYTAWIYINNIYKNLIKSKEAGDQFKEYSIELKKQLKHAIRTYHILANISINTYPWLYYEAWPFATLPYRAAKKYMPFICVS